MLRRVLALALGIVLLLPALALAEYVSVVGGKGKEINFRQGPSVDSKIVYKARRYFPVKVIGKKGGWLKTVDFQGDVAWVLGRLTTKKVSCVVIRVQKANIRRRPTTKSKVLFTAGMGASFKKVKKSGKWYLLEHADGDKGWVNRKLIWPKP